MNLCPDGCINDFFVGSIRFSVPDILHDCSGKQEDILLNNTDLSPQTVLRDIPHINTVDTDGSASNVIESGEQVAHRCLSASGRSDQSQGHTRFYRYAHISQYIFPVFVMEVHMIIRDFPSDIFKYYGIRSIFYFRLRTHDFKEP